MKLLKPGRICEKKKKTTHTIQTNILQLNKKKNEVKVQHKPLLFVFAKLGLLFIDSLCIVVTDLPLCTQQECLLRGEGVVPFVSVTLFHEQHGSERSTLNIYKHRSIY